jgi:uncharacterized protein YprB with RNaseH-like and TPR domain
MNRRIRDLVREQEEVAPTPTVAESSTQAKAASSSSWEDIANEIVPGAQAVRGSGDWRECAALRVVTPKPRPQLRAGWLRRKHRVPFCVLLLRPTRFFIMRYAAKKRACPVQGTHYLVSRGAADYDAAFADLAPRLKRVLEREFFPVLSGARVEDLLFVDIETTGLSSSLPLFLIGALRMDEEPRLELFLARDLPEEGAVLSAFNTLAAGKTLITFNGKSFDWPYIEGRSRAHRLPVQPPRAHLDLLHHARRQWKHSLPDCKLQTLELYLCGRTRVDDVAGREIPRTYHEFARTHAQNGTGAHLMSPILHHNALDILTMAELLCKTADE